MDRIKKNIFNTAFMLLFLFISSQIVLASDFTITACSPNKLLQGTTNANITFFVTSPLPQKNNDEFLYSSIYFSNPGIHIKSVSFKNPLILTCVIDIDKDASLDSSVDPVNVNIVSYDENGVPKYYSGQNMFIVERQPFIDTVTVDTPSGLIKKGESAKLILKGQNFLIGKSRVILMWSGVPPIDANCNSSNEVIVNISSDITKNIAPGKYGIYFYNSDNSANQAEQMVEVTE
jgi:hypothetical protein